jgi:hypothetical protein
MSGLFGGILELINIVGRLVLALLIGWTAASKKSSGARWARVAFGSIFVGWVVGGFGVYIAFTSIEDIPKDTATMICLAALIGLPVLILTVSIFLEILKRHIEDDTDTY